MNTSSPALLGRGYGRRGGLTSLFIPTASTMNKIDYKKVYREAYQASSTTPALVVVPPMRFLMLDGRGAEGSSPFKEGADALFSLARNVKLGLKQGVMGIDFATMPLEGIWWTEAATKRQDRAQHGEEKWTLMIMQPPVVDEEQVELARAELARKRSRPALGDIRFASFDEGLSVQMLHLGPSSEEESTLESLRRFAAKEGVTLSSNHHRIFLSDIRKGEPGKCRTILRQSVRGVKS